MSGLVSYLAGAAAEDAVARDYTRRGLPVVDRRWRGRGGEIDLVVKDHDGFVFVEVKKSGTHSQAAGHLTPAQMRRIYQTGSEYISRAPRGQDTPVRFDVALMDAQGRIEIIENAIGQ